MMLCRKELKSGQKIPKNIREKLCDKSVALEKRKGRKDMDYKNRFGQTKESVLQENDKVEVIIKSSLYCDEKEEPEYHSGIVKEIIYKTFKEGISPIGAYIQFYKDSFYEEQEEELVLFADIEEIFVKKYDVTGYCQLNKGMTLSVKGEGFGKIIRFAYKDGNLTPESICNGNLTSRSPITEEDKVIIREVYKYGIAQQFAHALFTKSK